MNSNDYRIGLGANGMVKIRDGIDLVVGVDQGAVWLTLDGDARDIVLNAGDSFRLDGKGMVLLQALGDAAVRFVPRDRTAQLDLSLS